MNPKKIYVLVQYSQQPIPKVVYSRPVNGNAQQLWADTKMVLSAKLMESKREEPLIIVYSPKGVFPECMMAHRWKSSPPEMDVFHFGNLMLL